MIGTPICKIRPGTYNKTKINFKDFVCFLTLSRFTLEGKRDYFASPLTLARTYGCSKDTVRRSIRKLERGGLINRIGYQVVHRPSRKVELFKTLDEATTFLKNNPKWTFSTTKYEVCKPAEFFNALRKVKKEKMAPHNFPRTEVDGLPSFLNPRAKVDEDL